MKRANNTQLIICSKVLCISFLIFFQSLVISQSSQLEGDYLFPNGKAISILNVELGLAFFNFDTDRFGILHKDSLNPTVYFAGPGAIGKSPKEIIIEFDPGNTSLLYKDLKKNNSNEAIKAEPFRSEEIDIPYENISLRSTLTYPHGDGPFPAVVMVHGGGSGPRSALKLWSNIYNRMGFACLVYDKREGKARETKGPSWETFADLADDVNAAVNYLITIDRIDKQRIGLSAYSQGGWVSSIAASQNEKIGFMVLVSCPVISPAERDSLSSVMRLETDGFGLQAIEEARKFTHTYNQAGRGNLSWEEYNNLLNQVSEKKWFHYVEFVKTKNSLEKPFYTSSYGRYYDPKVDLINLAIPILSIYGSNDKTVPPILNADKSIQYFGENHHHNWIVILPKANHSIMKSKTGSDNELIDINHYVSGYYDIIENWLKYFN